MTFHVGQRVVCVDDNWPIGQCICDEEAFPLKIGAVYTVRDLDSKKTYLRIRVHEFIRQNPCGFERHYDWPFRATRFRPLEEKPERIAIFREIARGITEGRPIIPDNEKVDHLVHLSAVADLHSFSIHNRNGKSRGFEPKLFQKPLNFIAVL